MPHGATCELQAFINALRIRVYKKFPFQEIIVPYLQVKDSSGLRARIKTGFPVCLQ